MEKHDEAVASEPYGCNHPQCRDSEGRRESFCAFDDGGGD